MWWFSEEAGEVLGMFSFSVMGPNGHVWSSHASVLICYYKLTKASKILSIGMLLYMCTKKCVPLVIMKNCK